MTGVFIRRGETHRRRRPCEEEAEAGGMWPQTQEHLEPQKWEELGVTLLQSQVKGPGHADP